MAGGDPGSRQLDQTPTWAVAGVCAIIIIISILLEKFLHKLGTWLTDRHKKALYDALEKVKTELMILGFISLLLVFSQYYIAKICVPSGVADSMLPCPAKHEKDKETGKAPKDGGDGHRRLLSLHLQRRFLAAAGAEPTCKEGLSPLISVDGLHQLHILIFFLAVFHVIYSAVTMGLGRLKIRGWKEWEMETSSEVYEFSNDPNRYRFAHQSTFVKAHTSFWTRIPIFFYIGCFFRQFFRSVSKADYLALRKGFMSKHINPGMKFNFQKYIKKSLEDDFQTVVGVSPVLWASFVVFLLINVSGWKALFWASLVPVVLILAVGTKLQAILTQMAVRIKDTQILVSGIAVASVDDELFWFRRPQLILHLIHFALFQNAFQVTYFLWIWYEFGLRSCFHNNFELVIVKLALGVGVLVLCSYITLPLYALIAQMGSQLKRSIFDDQTSKALVNWHQTVKKKKHGGGKSPSTTLGGDSSTGVALQRFKTMGHSYTISDLEATTNKEEGNLLIKVVDSPAAVEPQLAVPVPGEGGGAAPH